MPPLPAIPMEIQYPPRRSQLNDDVSLGVAIGHLDSATLGPSSADLNGLDGTCVPLFLLWALYFFTPAALSFGSGTVPLDTDIFRLFLNSEAANTALSLPGLYRLSRKSPSHFWGDVYPVSSQLDDIENFPGLTLYHSSYVIQFKLTDILKQDPVSEVSLGEGSSCQWIIQEISTLAIEYDTVLKTAQSAQSHDITGDRRVIETVFWSSITYYGTIVYFHLCFRDLVEGHPRVQTHNKRVVSLTSAVSQVLELSLKLHRSRPRLVVRIVWPLFIAGIAAGDRIYQDWVSIRLRELNRYGQNYDRISRRFDEIVQGSQSCCHEQGRIHYLGGGITSCI